MKWGWIVFFGLLASQLQADVVSELVRCDGIAEPSERLSCFNDVVDRHKSPSTIPKTSTPLEKAASVSAKSQGSGMISHLSNSDAIEAKSSMSSQSATSSDASLVVVGQQTELPVSVALVEPQEARPDWDKPKEKTLQEMHAKILGVRKLPRGQYVLKFDDGQVWREIEPRRQSRYSVGDEIVITRVFGGSFDLKSYATGYRNKVRRVE